MDPYTFTKEQIALTRSHERVEYFEYEGLRFEVRPGVFSPIHFPSTAIFSRQLVTLGGDTLLEVGCGAGVTTVVAALSGFCRVVGVDINPRAVENTRANIMSHRVEGVATARQSNMFGELSETDRFDVVFWNANFILAKEPVVDMYERAFFDFNYLCHEMYVRNVLKFLNPGGRALLGFSSLGDYYLLKKICRKHDLGLKLLSSEDSQEQGSPSYHLLQIEASQW